MNSRQYEVIRAVQTIKEPPQTKLIRFSTTASRKAYQEPRKKQGFHGFKLFLISIFVFEYVGYIKLLLQHYVYPKPSCLGKVLFITFHVIFVNALLSFIMCCKTNPGSVPLHWAFYRGDVAKRQRYCKPCNVWKPDRTHHCSVCGRCVLNMDHHCPWVENCIGLYNRRFFMLLLFYGILGLGFVALHGLIYLSFFFRTAFWTEDNFSHLQRDTLGWVSLILIMTAFSVLLLFALVQFFYFHFCLVIKNSTTIENLNQATLVSSRYDLGPYRNFQQVFGPSPFLWLVPLETSFTTPVGDGIRWI